MVTSRSGARWIVPKGILEPDLSPAASAAKEAFEEAGVEGRVLPKPVGEYSYEKWGGICQVEVFAMRVTDLFDEWDEDFRDREWVSLVTAIERVREPELKDILSDLPLLVGVR
ncbi:MAG: NUDIX hydrolase [Caldilineaceae bacterium]|nr:NUDIX hydrolase [Caldilineaceae bacterium]